MSRRGYPSTAHEYNSRGECIHCGMYRNTVDLSSHECKWWRENFVDNLGADAAGMSVEDWKLGNDLEVHKEEKSKLEQKKNDDGGALRQMISQPTRGN